MDVRAEDYYRDTINRSGPANRGGWGLAEHLQNLFSIAISKRAKSIVELGTGKGNSASAFLSAVHITGGKVWSIDKQPCYQERLDYRQDIEQGFIEFIQGESLGIGRTWDKEIDILFLDSDHSEAHVQDELETWERFVKNGGVILCHDTLDPKGERSDPYKAVEQFATDHKFTWTNINTSMGLAIISISK